MKQLYVVEVTREFVILADSETEAESLASEAASDDDSDAYTHAVEMTYYPGDWDDDCIPFGDRDDENPDRTLGEWIAMGAAPKLQKAPVEPSP